MTGLKHPKCCVCKFLKGLGVDEEKINDYHESNIGMEDFPPRIFKELQRFFEELDSNAHLVLSTSHGEDEEGRKRNESRTNYIMKRIGDLIPLGRSTFYRAGFRAQVSDAQVLGDIVSKFLRWEAKAVIEACRAALEDSNLSTLNKQFGALVGEA